MQVLEYMKSHIVYLDGAMGTCLQAAGLANGVRTEVWNLENPEEVIRVHQTYFEAGSNIVSANTFGANGLHYAPEKLDAIIGAAFDNARTARTRSGCTQPTWIALDIGSLGHLLAPLGDLSFDDAVEKFAEVVKLGVKHGADLILIETMSDSYETKAALLAAKENSDLPVFVSNSYDGSGRLMTGASPEAMIALLEGMRADAIGVNCSFGPKKLMPVIEKYLKYSSTPVFFCPNAGMPKFEDGRNVYDMTPDEWSAIVKKALAAGVRMVGGCCGADRDYIAAIIEATKDMEPVPIEKKQISWVSSGTDAVMFGGAPLLNAERINPNAMPAIKEAIRNHNIKRIVEEAIKEKKEGAHLIDVNVGLPEIDEPALLEEAVCAIQASVNVPLTIDTSDPVAMEAALRHYNGKAFIDTVNGKEENMAAIFPLAAKYGGMIVALPLDENGIPATAEERVAVAKKIIARAAEYGIDKSELVFDPLALTISTNTKAALETLKAVQMIHDMGCWTSLGVSNISFGLPARPLLNATFFLMAAERGLNTGIVNTGNTEFMNAYYSYCALHDYDPNCLKYLKYCASLPGARESGQVADAGSSAMDTLIKRSAGVKAEEGIDPVCMELREAIVDGMDDDAIEITERLLEKLEPLEIISQAVIPALDYVGKGYSEGDFFLPELLMSADAAQEACAVIKEALTRSGKGATTECKVVLATVHGDVHDIGKNIVKILLENYGFEVFDLGIDVPEEKVVAKVLEEQAPICALSALMTTSVPAMEKTIALLAEQAPDCKTVVGGAVLNQEYADKIHAHHYAAEAMDTVLYAQSVSAALKAQ